MDKRTAKRMADDFTGTVGDLRAMIASASTEGFSIVNPQIPKADALEIYRRAISGREDNETPKMFAQIDRSGGGTPDRMIVQNIYRDCA